MGASFVQIPFKIGGYGIMCEHAIENCEKRRLSFSFMSRNGGEMQKLLEAKVKIHFSHIHSQS